jgi:hypothetical protein
MSNKEREERLERFFRQQKYLEPYPLTVEIGPDDKPILIFASISKEAQKKLTKMLRSCDMTHITVVNKSLKKEN